MPRAHRAMRFVGCASTLSMFVGLAACGGSNGVTQPPDPVLASITLASNSVAAGSTVQGTASLDRAAKGGGANVSLSSSNASVATVPASVLVSEGAQSANFTVTGMAAGSVTITGNFGGSRTATVNVTAPPVLAVFSDPDSTFMTSDVRDVQGQIVRFDTANHALIWAATDRSFSEYPVSGNFIGSNRAFQVRFGTEAGERRAYFTETGPETICDIDVVNGQLVILPTNVRVPGGGS